MAREAHCKFSKDLGGRGHSKPKGANAVCKPTNNNSTVKIHLTPGKQNRLNDGLTISHFVTLALCTSKDSK